MTHKRSIFNISQQELSDFLKSKDIPNFRSKQIYIWLYRFGKSSFFEMNNIGKSLQSELDEEFYIYRPKIVNIAKSTDGTIKFLLELNDGNTIETVYIPSEKRNTICVSSQVGCAVSCKFCNTGYNGFMRNLSSEEIIGQYMIVKDHLNLWNSQDDRLSNVVFMGMGEPLYNMENVDHTINMLIHDEKDGLSRRKITLSTSGISPILSKIAPSLKCRLAISLHAPNDKIRSKIMPINNMYNIKSVMNACDIYYKNHPQMKITFEYLLLDGINDSGECAHELAHLIKNLNSKVNLIQFNSWNGCDFKPSSRKAVLNFAKIIESYGIEAPIRERRGSDIMAACGQLQSAK